MCPACHEAGAEGFVSLASHRGPATNGTNRADRGYRAKPGQESAACQSFISLLFSRPLPNPAFGPRPRDKLCQGCRMVNGSALAPSAGCRNSIVKKYSGRPLSIRFFGELHMRMTLCSFWFTRHYQYFETFKQRKIYLELQLGNSLKYFKKWN